MRLSTALLFLSSSASALPKGDATPQPRIANVSYWGSACPEGGFSVVVGSVNATTNIAPLTFTLANFLPELGSFGSSLRMCDIISHISVDKGWKIMVNARGTYAQGKAELPEKATMFLRSTYSFAEMAETESIGMLDVKGPLVGQFARRLTPVDGNAGAVGLCAGGELKIELQARAVEDAVEDPKTTMLRRSTLNETNWTLSTDMDISRCE